MIQGKGEWTITLVAGSGIGGMLSAIHGFNTGIHYLQNRFKGKVASFLSWGYELPKFAQLTVTMYYATSTASHYGFASYTTY